MDFGASPNLFRDASGRKLVGAGQKSGVYHVFDAKTMKPVWTQITGIPTSVGGIVGSTAVDDGAIYGPDTVPGYVWSISRAGGGYRWLGPIADGAHWGPPVAIANGIVYSVDFSGFLDAFDARNGVQLAKRPLVLGGGGPLGISWGGVSIARNTVFASVGVLGLADGFVVALRPGGAGDLADDLGETNLGGGGGGGGGGGAPAGPSVLAGPGAASTGYATPAMISFAGAPLSFTNLDVVQHDVTATDKGPDGRPLFQSKLIGLGETATVDGAEKLKSGASYSFYCSLHPGMKGTLAVQ
jgi:outer membrane protein assembly factor BamB